MPSILSFPSPSVKKACLPPWQTGCNSPTLPEGNGATERTWPGTGRGGPPSEIGERVPPDDLVALDQFGNRRLQGDLRLEARRLDLGVAHDVVALVRVLADGRLDDVEVRHLLLDNFQKQVY